MSIYEDASMVQQWALKTPYANLSQDFHVEAIETPAAGTHTYKLRMSQYTSGTVLLGAAASIPACILVEDITGASLGTAVSASQITSEAWSPYTPLWKSDGTQPSLGNGTLSGRYIKIGRTVHGQIRMTIGSTTTLGTGNWRWSLPVPEAGVFAWQVIGVLKAYNGGSSLNAIARMWSNGAADVGAAYSATAPAGAETNVGAAAPWSWVNGNEISINFTYEAAS